jgi:hypothetical protein
MNAPAPAATTGTNPIWWGLTIAIVVLAAAAGFRLLKSSGDFEFSGSGDGFKLIAEARANVASATTDLDELRRQIQAKDEALKKVAADLTSREGEIQKLLAQLETANKQAAATPAGQAVTDGIARLRANSAASITATPRIEWNRYESATRHLDAANSALARLPAKK